MEDDNRTTEDYGETEDVKVKLTKWERSKKRLQYWTSLFLGSICIISVLCFCLLIPMVTDPALTTLTYEFTDSPVTCRITNVTYIEGRSRCYWSSCAEGCTTPLYTCMQVRVQYSHEPFIPGKAVQDWVDLTHYDSYENETRDDVQLLINIYGCGYPPAVNCTQFLADSREKMEDGETIPCYYSTLEKNKVIAIYDYSDTMMTFVASIVVPNGLFLISFLVLAHWYSPFCQSAKKKKEKKGTYIEVAQSDNNGISQTVL